MTKGSRYYRVGPAIWLEPWDDDTRHVAFYVLTCEHRTTEGLFRMPIEYAIADMRWPARRFKRAFHELQRCGFIAYDQDAHVLLIEKALQWQSPENPNQVKAAIKALASLPPSPLLRRFAALAQTYSERLAVAMREEFPEVFGEPFAEGFDQAFAESPSPPPSPPTSGGSPVVSGCANGRTSSPPDLAEEIRGILQRGIDGLTTDEIGRSPTRTAIAAALEEHKPAREDALAVANEVRSIAQSQNRAPNIASLYAARLAQHARGVAA